MNRHSRFPRHPLFFLALPAALAIFGFIIMQLWNALMPELFRLPRISFWQAVGLFILSRLLLGGFFGGGGGGGRSDLRRRMRERWEHMTPEQREKFRRRWRNRWEVDFEDQLAARQERCIKAPKRFARLRGLADQAEGTCGNEGERVASRKLHGL